MLDKYLERLSHAAPAVPHDGLEAAVWTRIAADEKFFRSRNVILGWQAGIVALVVVGSITVGGLFAPPPATSAHGLDAFSTEGVPAPSTLLLGNHS